MNILDSVFARFYDRLSAPLEQRGLSDRRRELLAGLHGDVLEIGAGTGRNVELYPDTVTALTLTEPSPPMLDRLRATVAGLRPEATVVSAPAERLPFPASSFDAAVSTLVLCSVDDLDAAVRELRRVLRDEGTVVVFEHVAHAGGATAAQRLWEPAQKVLGRNCHLTRDIRGALDRAGFDTSLLVDTKLPGGTPVLFPAIAGVARPLSAPRA